MSLGGECETAVYNCLLPADMGEESQQTLEDTRKYKLGNHPWLFLQV